MAGDTGAHQPSNTPFSHPFLTRHPLLAGGSDLLALTAQLAAWMVLPATCTIARSLLENRDANFAKGCEYFLCNESYDMIVPIDWRARHLESFFPDVVRGDTNTKGEAITNPASRRGTIAAALRHWRHTCEKLRKRLEVPASFEGHQDPWMALAGVLTLVHVNPDEPILTDEAGLNHRDYSLSLMSSATRSANTFKTPETPKRSRAIEIDDHHHHTERAPKKRYTSDSPMQDNIHVKTLPPRLTPTPIRLLHHRSEDEDTVLVPGLHNSASVCHPVFTITDVSTVAAITPNLDDFVILTAREKQQQESLQKFKIRSLEREVTQLRRRLKEEQMLREQCQYDKADAERKYENITMESLKKQEKLIRDLEEKKERLREALRDLAKEL